MAKTVARAAIEHSKDANAVISIFERLWKTFKIVSPLAAATILAPRANNW